MHLSDEEEVFVSEIVSSIEYLGIMFEYQRVLVYPF